MTTERWLPVPGWEGFYEVSDYGNVRSVDRTITRSDGQKRRFKGKTLSPGTNRHGYPLVVLSRPGITKTMRSTDSSWRLSLAHHGKPTSVAITTASATTTV